MGTNGKQLYFEGANKYSFSTKKNNENALRNFVGGEFGVYVRLTCCRLTCPIIVNGILAALKYQWIQEYSPMLNLLINSGK